MSSYGYVGAGNPFFKRKTRAGNPYGYVGSGYNAAGKLGLLPKPQPPKPPADTLGLPVDFDAILNTHVGLDPRSAALKAIYDPANPNAGSSAAARTAAVRSALIRYGAAPGSAYKDVYGDVDPATVTASQQNSHSVLAELLANYQRGLGQTRNNLEERGLYNSGARGQAEERLGNAYEGDYQHALETLGDLIAQAESGYTQAGDTYRTQQASLVNDVRGQLQNDTSIRTGQAHLVQGSKSRYGRWVYADALGNLYVKDAQGKTVPFTPPPQRSPRELGVF